MRNLIKYLIYLYGSLFHHNRKSKVVYYHDVGTTYTDMGTSLSLLGSHIEVMKKKGFLIVDKIEQADNQIMIAFDDGWKGLYDNRGFFIEQKIHPTVFIAVDLIGQDGYMTVEEIKELMSLGFYFQSHSWTHTGLPDHHGQDLKHELLDSKNELERLFGKSFDEICFPQGRFSNEVIEVCHASGYKLMYTSLPGAYYDDIDNMLICRNLLQYSPKSHVELIITGDVPLFKKRLIRQHYNSK